MPTSTPTTVRTLDGLRLGATVDRPDGMAERGALLVHGAGVTREEGGFFTRLAAGLAEAGVASLRLDLPGHGESEGRQEDLTFASILNIIEAGLGQVRSLTGGPSVSVIAASFSGGVAAYFAAKRPDEMERLVLLNPLIDYKRRFVEEKPAWASGAIDEKAGRQLLEQGYVGHGPSFKLGRPILNEVFWFEPRTVLGEITVPTLIVHGTKDTFIPVESSREADRQLGCEHRLIELEGAQHGFAVHDDPSYADLQSQEWQAFVVGSVGQWLTGDSRS
jgi:pimeloyl-ACP methyl ester carboxylesterase